MKKETSFYGESQSLFFFQMVNFQQILVTAVVRPCVCMLRLLLNEVYHSWREF